MSANTSVFVMQFDYMGWSGRNNTSGAASVTPSRNAELTSLANLWLRIQELLESLYTQRQCEGEPVQQSCVPNLSRFLTSSTFNWKNISASYSRKY